ncbi:sugar phosphate isomerase/epimerase [Sphingobium sufflavum]|uniref:sugar phosphate isomerase/epimerase family protein n=1 Tax=Sphingobium sufflavum TaxID=1129547 RepID=UPI001F1CFB59|nr:sugar phosphate isomerase/epimerase [Sphingobium sufflavum]MCE7797990.1 sugar phosphate isomerase/epimerase [Sphingobium sufflavum]
MTIHLDRRALLASLATGGAMAALGGHAIAASRKPFFARVGLPIGLQLYTLGDEPKKDLDGTLTRIAAIGYREIELPELYGKTPAQFRAAADKAGVKPSCMHLAVGGMATGAALSLNSAPQRIADDLGTLGIRQAVLPIVPFPEGMKPRPGENFFATISRSLAEGGADYWKRTAAQLNEKAAALKPHGISLGYHNHNVEFMKVGEGTAWDILVRETDPALVSFEVDIGWIAAAGLDPVAFLRRHKGRVRQLHVKDLKASTKVNTVLSMDPAEVGSGKQDWARILPAAYDAGVRNFYVEQEPPFVIPRMDAVEKSFAYLSKLVA